MHEVQKKELARILKVLEGMKDEIGYAIEVNDKTFGNRELKPKRETKRRAHYPFGETRKHYLPYLQGAKVGDVVSIPFDRFDGHVLASNVSAACIHLFGKGNATTHKNETTKCVEVLVTGVLNEEEGFGDLLDIFE